MLFHPNEQISTCPVCGSPLNKVMLDQFGVPIGYQAQCSHCAQYSDMWVNGLREVQCGQWNSGDYESDYGSLTKAQKWEQCKALWKLNVHLCLERAVWQLKQWRQSRAAQTLVKETGRLLTQMLPF